MTFRSALYLFSRMLFAAFAMLASMWCLLAWIPFTWQQVIKGHLLPPLSAFAEQAHLIHLGVLAVLALQLWISTPRLATKIFLAAQLALALYDVARPILAHVQNAPASFTWAGILLLPLPWLGFLDCLQARRNLAWAPRQARTEARAFYAAWRATLFVIAWSALPVYFANQTSVRLAMFLWAAGSHFVLFAVVFLAVALTSALASFFARPSRVEFVLIELTLGIALFFFLSATIFPGISFQGGLATAASAAFALALTLFFTGVAATLGGRVTTGLDLAISPLTTLLGPSVYSQAAFLMLLAVGAGAATRALSSFDWNYLGQELVAAISWGLAFALFFSISGRRSPRLRAGMPAVFAAGGLCIGYAALYSRLGPDQLLQDYASRNVSYRLIRSIVAPPADDSAFYAFLNAISNVARSVNVKPVDIQLAGKLSPSGEPRPNIFVIVIDSLRRDYVGAYNPAVTFTPALDAFARDNTAFPNAFTRYGGTGLAEPSIWVGGMTLHKQYITPFYPMNSLAKLVSAEGYQQLVSMDNILNTVVPSAPALIPLDKDRLTMDFALCGSLEELKARLPHAARPVFAYTQPQNLHIATITREGKTVPPGENYPGFYAPYASRLRRMDACFGNFIAYLKASGLYDSSVVIVTADHGDSLGEEGRWGHAYTLFPEILRIPLLIHLAGTRKFGPLTSEAVFSSDITPTLYDLLGHVPTTTKTFLGRSLFAPPRNEPDYLVAASYAAVYGLVNRQGTRLLITDAVNARDYLYTLPATAAAPGALSLTPEDSIKGKKRIRELLGDLNDFYSFRPAAP